MNSDISQSLENLDAFSKMEEHLQHFFEKAIEPEDASELLRLLTHQPDLRKLAVKSYQAERLLQYVAHSRAVLSPERLKELEQEYRLQSDPRDTTESFSGQADHLDLEKLVSLAATSETIIPEKEVVPSTAPPARPYSKDGSSWISPKVLVAVLLTFFILGIYSEFFIERDQNKEKPFRPLARIAAVIDLVPDETGEIFKEGRLLENERIRFQSGMMQLELDNGVEMILEGPTELVIRGRDTVFCSFGQASATVAPAGKGFKVETPYATVVDLGTQFSLSVDSEKTAVHVLKGLVDVSRNQMKVFNISEGKAIEYDQRGRMKQFKSDPDTFITSAIWQTRLNNYSEQCKTVWQREQKQLSDDPNLLACLDDAVLQGPRRVAGYCDNPNALRFRAARDYAKLSAPGEYRNLTLLAVVRIDDMKNVGNLICMDNTFLETPGGFSWQVDSRGAILFHVHGDDGIHRFDTEPLLRRSDWKTWIMMAMVVNADQKEVSHFIDGRKVASFSWDNPRPLHFTEGTVGNNLPNRKDRSIRFWNGDIDSFYIYSRPFSEAELKNVSVGI